jgi:hypothetical protein
MVTLPKKNENPFGGELINLVRKLLAVWCVADASPCSLAEPLAVADDLGRRGSSTMTHVNHRIKSLDKIRTRKA